MKDFIFFMHGGTRGAAVVHGWAAYVARLRAAGAFEGGSSVGEGACFRKEGAVPDTSRHITGYVRVRAAGLAEAAALLEGNPVYEAGGVIEIRELPRDP